MAHSNAQHCLQEKFKMVEYVSYTFLPAMFANFHSNLCLFYLTMHCHHE